MTNISNQSHIITNCRWNQMIIEAEVDSYIMSEFEVVLSGH